MAWRMEDERRNAMGSVKPPSWLLIGAAVILVEECVRFFALPLQLLNVLSIVIAVLVAGYLLKGSRVAWLVALLGAATALVAPLIWHEPWWTVATSALIVVCLVAPSSLYFVWGERPNRFSKRWVALGQQLSASAWAGVYWVLALAGPSPSSPDRPSKRQSEVALQSLLAGVAIVTACLFVLMGAVANWHDGSGSDSAVVDILWRIVWMVYTVAKVVLVGVVVATIYQFVAHRKSSVRPNGES